MASWKQFFKGNLLSAKKLGKRIIKAKVQAIETETLRDKDGEETIRLVMVLVGVDEKVKLNKMNCSNMDKAWGEDWTNWVGKMVQVKTGPQQFMGESCEGLHVTPIKK